MKKNIIFTWSARSSRGKGSILAAPSLDVQMCTRYRSTARSPRLLNSQLRFKLYNITHLTYDTFSSTSYFSALLTWEIQSVFSLSQVQGWIHLLPRLPCSASIGHFWWVTVVKTNSLTFCRQQVYPVAQNEVTVSLMICVYGFTAALSLIQPTSLQLCDHLKHQFNVRHESLLWYQFRLFEN